MPRQIPGLIRMLRTHKRNRPRRRQTLDRFSKQANVRCGPISGLAPADRYDAWGPLAAETAS
jgi:hypothetical protein